jgi:phosphate transport system substrate-binding protein
MADLYALCTNVGKCRKTGPNDIVAIDTTIGGVVVCSECGRRLTLVPGSPERFADVSVPAPASAPAAVSTPRRFVLPAFNMRLAFAGSLFVLASIGALWFFHHVSIADSVATIRVCGASTATTHLADDFARKFFQTRGAASIQTSAPGDGNQITVSTRLAGDATPTEIQIAGHGSSRGFAALDSGRCDLVISLRPIYGNEAAPLRGLRSQVIGRDGIVVAVSPIGYVQQLTDDQLRGIFSGEISSWAQVGGPDRKIDVIVPDDPSEYDGLRQALFNDQDPAATAQEIPMASIGSALGADRDAIAIGSYAALGPARAIRIVGRLSDLVPTLQNIQSGAYPFTPRLYVYTAHETVTPRLLPTFVAYLSSASAGSVVSGDGLVANR